MSNSNRRSLWRTVLKGLILLTVCLGLGLGTLSMLSQPPENRGLVNGKLPECPASPNCVSTQTSSPSHQMPAIPFSGSAPEAIAKLKRAITDSFGRARLVQETEHYLRYEFTSFVFRFVDDVEFLVDDENGLIHFRSASRVGYSDMGANRRRMTRITEEFKR